MWCRDFSLQSLLLLCLQALGTRVYGLSICGDGLSWDLPRPRIEPLPPALQGFLTTGPPRKPYDVTKIYNLYIFRYMTPESSYLVSNPTNIRIRLGGSRWTQKLERYLPLLHIESGEQFAVLNNSLNS